MNRPKQPTHGPSIRRPPLVVGWQWVGSLPVRDGGRCSFWSESWQHDEYTELFWRDFWEEDGCAAALTNGDYSTLFHQAEVWSPRAWANTPLGSAYASMGMTDEILVPMPPLGGTDRRLLLFRGEDAPLHSA